MVWSLTQEYASGTNVAGYTSVYGLRHPLRKNGPAAYENQIILCTFSRLTPFSSSVIFTKMSSYVSSGTFTEVIPSVLYQAF